MQKIHTFIPQVPEAPEGFIMKLYEDIEHIVGSFLNVSANSKVVDYVKTQKLQDPIRIIGRSWAFTNAHPRCAIAKSVTILAQAMRRTINNKYSAHIRW